MRQVEAAATVLIEILIGVKLHDHIILRNQYLL